MKRLEPSDTLGSRIFDLSQFTHPQNGRKQENPPSRFVIYLMCMNVLSIPGVHEDGKGVGYPGSRIKDGCELPGMC